MIENFTVTVGRLNGSILRSMRSIIISLIIGVIIIYPISGLKTTESLISLVLLTLILYFIISSITNENLSNELPSSLYPSMPHTGLDGISLNSYITGLDILEKKY